MAVWRADPHHQRALLYLVTCLISSYKLPVITSRVLFHQSDSTWWVSFQYLHFTILSNPHLSSLNQTYTLNELNKKYVYNQKSALVIFLSFNSLLET